MDQWAIASGTTNYMSTSATTLADAMIAMKAAFAAIKPLLPSKPYNPWLVPMPSLVRWPKTIYVYAYPAERWCAYSASDYEWARWCRLGRAIRVEYDEETKEVTKLPSGWVLPDDWFYGCDGSREPMIRYMDWPIARAGTYSTILTTV